MIGKPIVGKSFGGCVRYLLNRQEASILEAEGIRLGSPRSITVDFNQQRKLRPGLGKAVGHTILSWSSEDSKKLTDKMMLEVAKKYMKVMKIIDTQYLVVKHTDRKHPHLHIVFNRVDNYGKTISDNNNYLRNVKACRELTEQHGFYLAYDKKHVNRQRLKGNDKVRYAIHDAVKEVLLSARNWKELVEHLEQKGIGTHFKYKSNSSELQGISFSKDGLIFKGSSIDRSLSFTCLDKLLKQRHGQEHKVSQAGIYQRSHEILPNNTKQVASFEPDTGIIKEVQKAIDMLIRNEGGQQEYDPFEQELKKKKRRKFRGLSQ